jgi:anti-anti-sigma factor
MVSESERPPDDIFQMTEELRGETVVLALVGELDLATVGAVERRLAELHRARRAVVLDLDRLTFLDSTGIRLVLSTAEDAQRDAWSFAMTHGSEQVRRVLTAAGVAERLPYADSKGT